MDFTNALYEYARLLIRTGLNVQPGQNLVISSPVECAEFARICATEAYNIGCREVHVNWGDDYLTREKFIKAQDDVFDTVSEWKVTLYDMSSSRGDAWLSISASDPENLVGAELHRIKRSEIALGTALKDFRRRQMNNDFPWCVAGVPTEAWARKVYPDMVTGDAVRALWQSIFLTMRISGDGTSSERWAEHLMMLERRRDILNDLAFAELRYKNSLGTDLTVGLPHMHRWDGGMEKTKTGFSFCANMPTEEIFTAPDKRMVNGRAVSSMPLVLNGSIISNFALTFKDGKVEKIEAAKGKDLIESAISVDEGASYLGEVALVPHDSPISNMNTLFYNTLFDENASCHLALGASYNCRKDIDEREANEFIESGLNESMTHIDFMIGTPDMTIIGITQDGREVPVFENGNFVF